MVATDEDFKEGEEFGRVSLNNNTDLVVKRIWYKGEGRIDIRKFVKTEKYVGWSTQGISIPDSVFKDVLEILKKVKI